MALRRLTHFANSGSLVSVAPCDLSVWNRAHIRCTLSLVRFVGSDTLTGPFIPAVAISVRAASFKQQTPGWYPNSSPRVREFHAPKFAVVAGACAGAGSTTMVVGGLQSGNGKFTGWSDNAGRAFLTVLCYYDTRCETPPSRPLDPASPSKQIFHRPHARPLVFPV